MQSRTVFCCLILILFQPSVFAQDAEPQKAPEPTAIPIQMPAAQVRAAQVREAQVKMAQARAIMLPAVPIRPGRMPSLTQLVKAKLNVNGEKAKLILMLPSYRMEKQKGEQRVTKMRQEQRTRVVNVNGKQVEQTYTVSIPFTETVVDPMVPVSAGIKPNTFDADQFEFFDQDGKSLSAEDAAKHLSGLGPAFLLERFRGNFEGFSELQREALNPNCIVIASPETIQKRPPVVAVSAPLP